MHATRSIRNFLTMLLLAVSAVAAHAQVPMPTDVTVELPGLWQAASGKAQVSALKVAQLDAQRSLAERIYGVRIDGATSVYDFVLASDKVESRLDAILMGASRTEAPVYTEDGIVYVVYGVKLRTIVEMLKMEAKRTNNTELSARLERLVYTEDTLVEARGNGALEGSPGLAKIRAKRAAELDAYRNMLARITGIHLTSETTTKDMCLENDKILAAVAAYMQGMKPSRINYMGKGICEVEMQLKVREIIQTIETIVRRYDSDFKTTSEVIMNVNQDIMDHVFTVTGSGVGTSEPSTAEFTSSVTMSEQITTLQTVISQAVVAE